MGYKKIIEAGTFEDLFYQALGFPPVLDEEEVPLVLRITLGDMDLLDAFYMALPEDAASLSIEDAIRKYVVCETEEERIEVKRRLAEDPNPDLLDIHNDLVYLYKQAEAEKVVLNYHINNGASDISQKDYMHLHQQHCITADERKQVYNLIDLVLEVYDNLDPFSGLSDDQKESMLCDFRRIFILYLMDKFDYNPGLQDARYKMQDLGSLGITPGALDLLSADHLSSILEYLTSEEAGLLGFQEEYFITPRGYDLLNSIINEAEFYIDNYDIFGDVYVRGDVKRAAHPLEVKFNTGYGEDLIIPVLIREGIDPYRVLFVAALYLGNMDYLASDLDLLFSDIPFKALFSLIPHSLSEDIGAELLDEIIRSGKAKIQKRQLREARIRRIRNIERRIGKE